MSGDARPLTCAELLARIEDARASFAYPQAAGATGSLLAPVPMARFVVP